MGNLIKYLEMSYQALGNHPGEQCCCCFEIKCGMAVLTILQVINTGWTFYHAFQYNNFDDSKVHTYSIVSFIMGLPYIAGVVLSVMWLANDNIASRGRLAIAYIIFLVTQILVILWNII